MQCTYVVGRYKRAGNFMGKYKENVEKGTFSKDMCNNLDALLGDSGEGNGM